MSSATPWKSVEPAVAQLLGEQRDVALEERRDPFGDRLRSEAGERHEIAHDLRVGLSVVAVLRRAGGADRLGERRGHRPAAGAVAPEERAVDVEEDEPHVRVSTTPAMIVPAPSACQGVGTSPSAAHAAPSAITGWRFEYIAVRVGPSTCTPRYQKR